MCRHRLAQLEQAHATITAAGLQNIIVAIGEPKHAQRYGKQLAPSAQCFCSPDLRLYREFGMRRGAWGQLLGFNVIAKGIAAAAAGQMQGEATGDTQMIGGTFVIDTTGLIHYAHYDAYAGDHPPIADILSSLQGKFAQPQ